MRPIGRHRGGLDREHASARLQHLAPVHGVPVGGAAVDGRVLAHGRYDDAVGEGEFPELEGENRAGDMSKDDPAEG